MLSKAIQPITARPTRMTTTAMPIDTVRFKKGAAPRKMRERPPITMSRKTATRKGASSVW